MTVSGRPSRPTYRSRLVFGDVKWLVDIEVIGHAFEAFFQTKRYHHGWECGGAIVREPVRLQRVRALIAEPLDGASVSGDQFVLHAVAWSGAAPVERVDVCVGEGPWQPARLIGEPRRHSWLRWELFVRWDLATQSRSTVRARATDLTGRTQPEQPKWNRLGHGRNAIQKISVVVV